MNLTHYEIIIIIIIIIIRIIWPRISSVVTICRAVAATEGTPYVRAVHALGRTFRALIAILPSREVQELNHVARAFI